MSKARIVYIVVDTQRLTLYTETGETITVNQGDPRVPGILETAMPLINIGLVAEIDLAEPNSYQAFEKQGSGLVRFFKVAKQKLASLFADPVEPIEPGEFGIKPEFDKQAQVAEVMAHARPADGHLTKEEATRETVVAVVGAGAEARVIPNAQQVHDHIAHAVTLGSTKGMEAFFRRLAGIIDQRGHTVDELLNFMKKGDLPVSDDGSIIAYKRLYRDGSRYVDPHTRKVNQGIGSFVCMDEKLVDPSRRTECSQGLHIGRRGYMGGFRGDTICLVKIAPEDVIAVPRGEPDKMRVCGYHLLSQLSIQGFGELCGNRPISSADDRALLAHAIAGTHVGVLEEVKVTGPAGAGVIITPKSGAQPAPISTPDITRAKPLDDESLPKAKAGKPVDPKTLVANPAAKPAGIKEPEPMLNPYKKQSYAEQAKALVDTLMDMSRSLKDKHQVIVELRTLKKTSKKGWDKLGVSAATLKLMDEIFKDQPAEPKVKTSAKTKALSAAMKPKPEPVQAVIAENPNQLRDDEIHRLFKAGKSKREIGRLLGIAESTVRRILK